MKTITEINRKIKDHDVTVLTAKELCDAVRSGESISAEDVDVVTTATRCIMSGSKTKLTLYRQKSSQILWQWQNVGKI